MTKNPKSVNPIPLSDLIDALRDDLLSSAAKRPSNWRPVFEIGEAVVETSVTFQRDLEVGGKVKVFVAEFGPNASEKSGAIHKLSVKLLPAKNIASRGQDLGLTVVTPLESKVLMRGKGNNKRRSKRR